jgi:hypothetical protein
MQCWQQTSTRTPLRPDGKPNRPLSLFSVLVQDAPSCREYRPDHNGECLTCDEPADAHQLPRRTHD